MHLGGNLLWNVAKAYLIYDYTCEMEYLPEYSDSFFVHRTVNMEDTIHHLVWVSSGNSPNHPGLDDM